MSAAKEPVVNTENASGVKQRPSQKPSVKPPQPKWPVVLLIGLLCAVPGAMVVNTLNLFQKPKAVVVATQPVQAVATDGIQAASSDVQATLTPVLAMNMTPAAEISFAQIDRIDQTLGVRAIVFRDGSRLNVDDFVLQQLPEEVRLRFAYSRDANAN
jgi:hypothetical protein